MKNLAENKPVTIANGTDAYAQGDMIGAPMKIDVANNSDSGNSVLLQQLSILDLDEQGKKLKVVVLSDEITAPADNAAFAPSADDLKKVVDVIAVDTYNTFSNGKFAVVKNIALTIATETKRPFWLAVLADEAVTFTSASKLIVTPIYYVD